MPEQTRGIETGNSEHQPGAIDWTITGLRTCIEPEGLQTAPQTPNQLEKTRELIERVVIVQDELRRGELTPMRAIARLYDTYFVFQGPLEGTEQAHLLRVAGDELGIEHDIDFETTWELYQESLGRAERGLI